MAMDAFFQVVIVHSLLLKDKQLEAYNVLKMFSPG